MNTVRTIAARELGSYFKSGAGWALIALFMFISGAIVWMTALSPGRAASLRIYFDLCGWLLLPVAPAVTMRLIAEEIRSGTIETLLTAPVSAAQLVIGKFTGALGFLLCAMIPTAIYVALLYHFASPAPDAGAILAGYLSLVLLHGRTRNADIRTHVERDACIHDVFLHTARVAVVRGGRHFSVDS